MRRALIVLCLLVLPVRAHAWTDAVVRSVRAEVDLAADASAYVTVTATVRVNGGWLEGLEIAGLDPELVIDEEYEPWAEDHEGGRYSPRLQVVRGDRVQVSFPGRSPRRGSVRIGFAYHTTLAHRATEPLEEQERVRVRWTLPGWRSGLDGVEIIVRAPAETRLGPRDGEDTGAELRTSTEELEDGRAQLSWRRDHLPRTMPWTVSVDVPASAMDEALRGTPVVHLPPAPTSAVVDPEADPTLFWIALSSALALIALLQILFVSRRAGRALSVARPLVPAPAIVRLLCVLALAPAAACAGTQYPRLALGLLAALSLLAAYRPGSGQAPSKLGVWRVADARWLRLARLARWRRWVHPEAFLDLTTPLGLAHTIAWLSIPLFWVEAPVSTEVLLAVAVSPLPILASGTRFSFPASAAEALGALLGEAARLRDLPEGVTLRPTIHVSVDGDVQEARVRTALAHRADGLLRLDLALGHLQHAGGFHARPMWLAVTRAGSPADEALGQALPGIAAESSRGGRRVARSVEVRGTHFIEAVVEALAECPSAPIPSRGEALPQETVHDLPAPRAVGF